MWNDTRKIIDEAFKILDGKEKKGNCPELWDGNTAQRIVKMLVNREIYKKEKEFC